MTFEDALRDFVSQYGFLGIGRRYRAIYPETTIEEAFILVEEERVGLYGKSPIQRLEPQQATPEELQRLREQGYRVLQRGGPHASDHLYLVWRPDRSDYSVDAAQYLSPYYPDRPVEKIRVDSEELWSGYSERIGDFSLEEVKRFHPLWDRRWKQQRDQQLGSEGRGQRAYSLDTLSYHVRTYGAVFNALVTGSGRGSLGRSMGKEASMPVPERVGRVFDLLSFPVKPRFHLALVNVPGLDGPQFRWEFPSLLDACYLMLALDLAGPRRIAKCPWCGKFNRFPGYAPHNSEYCPPSKDSGFKSCSQRFTDLKYKQRTSWNLYLKASYGDSLSELESAWGIPAQEEPGPWMRTGRHSVMHPVDLRLRGPLTQKAKADYKDWRTTLQRSRLHERILNDTWILSDDH